VGGIIMTETLKEIAEMYAVGSIGEEDVTFLLQKSNEPYRSFEELPVEFHDYVNQFIEDYNNI
jgi:hypothetical protein